MSLSTGIGLLEYTCMQPLVENKQITRNYTVQETLMAGIELHGYEVKSLRKKHGSLRGAHVTVRGGQAWLLNAHIPAYQPANTPQSYDPHRKRKLLLHTNEIAKLASIEDQGGLTVVPTGLYDVDGLIKARVAVAKGKKKHDKREDIKKRDMQRDIERTLKNKNL